MTFDARCLKRDKLRDLIRRAIANPGRIEQVVIAISADWFPTIKVNNKGVAEIKLGEEE